MKKMALFIMFVFLFSAAGIASANHGKGHGFSLKDACYMELMSLYKNAKELKLTDEQLKTIKDKKYEIKRQHIQLDAQMELVKLDIKKEFSSDAPNQTQIDALIDNKVELKRTLNKAFAKAIVDARTLLTPEQRTQHKEILWSGWAKGGKCSHGHHGRKK